MALIRPNFPDLWKLWTEIFYYKFFVEIIEITGRIDMDVYP